MQRKGSWHAASVKFVILASLCGSASAQDYYRLVPTKPVLPLNIPEISNKASGYKSAISLLAKVGPWYNESRVFKELEKNVTRELEKGFAEVAQTGQRGVLIKVQVLSTPQEAGPYYQLRGDGATFVGTGPNADAVCFAKKCFGDNLDAPIPAGASLAQGSGYVWVERGTKGQYTRSLYQASSLEDRAKQTYFNQETRDAYMQAVKGEAYSAYVDNLSTRLKLKEQKETLAVLEAKRKETIAQVAKIEEEYAKEMRRQAQIQRNYENLAALHGILSTASMLASAQNAIGENLGDAADFSSPEAVLDKLKAMAAASGAEAADIKVRQTTQKSAQGEIERQTLEFGAKFEMPVPAPQGTVLLPLP
jgi:hypothetical protein